MKILGSMMVNLLPVMILGSTFVLPFMLVMVGQEELTLDTLEEMVLKFDHQEKEDGL